MGRDLRCLADTGDGPGEVRALLESTELRLRGASRLTVPFAEVSDATVEDGRLTLRRRAGTVVLWIGDQAGYWRTRVLAPPRSVADKLGAKAGQTWVLLQAPDGHSGLRLVIPLGARDAAAATRRRSVRRAAPGRGPAQG